MKFKVGDTIRNNVYGGCGVIEGLNSGGEYYNIRWDDYTPMSIQSALSIDITCELDIKARRNKVLKELLS